MAPLEVCEILQKLLVLCQNPACPLRRNVPAKRWPHLLARDFIFRKSAHADQELHSIAPLLNVLLPFRLTAIFPVIFVEID